MNYSTIDFKVRGDARGCLVALEQATDIPFDIQRIYYIYNTLYDVVRGCHAHRDLEQVVICLSGSCDFILDDSFTKETIHLDSPDKGLYLKNNIWREFTHFSEDCVIMVVANRCFDEADYIRNYDEFKNWIKNNSH